MSTENEELAFDSDGIPILTNIVYDDEDNDQPQDDQPTSPASAEQLHDLLQSKAFGEQLDELATALARNIRKQLERDLRSAVDAAISYGLDSGDKTTRQAIRKQLDSALPELLARALKK